jgi:hypothetical protein
MRLGLTESLDLPGEGLREGTLSHDHLSLLISESHSVILK